MANVDGSRVAFRALEARWCDQLLSARHNMEPIPLCERETCAQFMVTSSSAPYRKVAAELCGLLPTPYRATVRHGKDAIHGTASFSAPVNFVSELARLSFPERVYVIVGNIPAVQLRLDSTAEELQAQLESLSAEAEGWPAALMAHHILHPSLSSPQSIRFAVSAKRRGKTFKQLINDFALARHIGSALHLRFGWTVDLTRPNLEVSASLNDEGLLLAVTLLRRSDSMDCRRPFPGLDPQVAWAMVRSLGALPPQSLVVDTMVGKGSLLFEALAAHPTCMAIGLDADVAQLAKSEANRRAAPRNIGQRLSLVHADAMAVPLPDNSCAGLLCDLPFESDCPRYGHRIDTSRGASLEAVIGEFARLLAGQGSRAVLLLNEARMPALRSAMEAQAASAKEPDHATDGSAGASARRHFHVLCERPCPLGFTQAVIVVAELRVAAQECAAQEWCDPAESMRKEERSSCSQPCKEEEPQPRVQDYGARSAPRSSLPWEEGSLRRADWAALRLERRKPMIPWYSEEVSARSDP